MLIKHCPKCNTDKQTTEFSFSSRRKDGLQTECKLCRKKMANNHYLVNKQNYLQRAIKSKKEYFDWFRRLKEENPCLDCGKKFPYYVMEFDHVKSRGKKIEELSKMARRQASKDEMMAEIAKCDLVCCLCHRFRTHKHRGIVSTANTVVSNSTNLGSNPCAPAE